MNDEDKLKPPEEGIGDYLHVAVSGGLSLIPGVGGIMDKIFSTFVKTPLQKNLEEWRNNVSFRLAELGKSCQISLERLGNDPDFTTVFIQATMVAMRNHQKEKHASLRNAVINSACKIDIDVDMQLTFIRFIDELTPTHIKLLVFLIELNTNYWKRDYDELNIKFCETNDLKISFDHFMLLWGDLKNRVLIYSEIHTYGAGFQNGDSFPLKMPEPGLKIEVTELAKDFLRYIQNEVELGK